MALQKADFILIDYTAKVKETNEVFEGWVMKALDDSLVTMEVSKPSTVEIPPEKAFGPRDAEKVKRVHLRHLVEKGINPVIGARVEFGGINAIVRSIGAGRVLLDFNPPLAGRTLIYEVTVNKKLETSDEKIGALIHRRIPPVEEGKFKFVMQDKTLTVDMPEDTFYLEGVQIAKRGIVNDVQKFFPDLEETKFVDTFKAPPKPAKAPEVAAEAPATEAKTEAQAAPAAAEEKTEQPQA
jgi:peptidylprolyl isomerase